MAKPVIAPVSDPQIQSNFTSIREILTGGLSYDNMLFQVITGTTSDTPDTASQIIHSMTPRPIGWNQLIGDVYVQEISDKFIDVRSTKPNVSFKIVIFGGPPVTGESLTAVGTQGYLNTTEVIQQTPVIQITNVTDATIKIQPTQVTLSSGAIVAAGSGGSNNQYMGMANDASYFYVTQGTVANTTALSRVNRSTGAVDTLTIGSRQLGAMTLIGTTLYVAQRQWDAANTILVFSIDTNTFTSSTITINALATAAFNISDIYIDGTNIYLCGADSATLGSGNATMIKAPIAGGAGSTIQIKAAAGNGFVGRKIISDGTNLWCVAIEESSTAQSSLCRISLAAFTLTSNTNIPQSSRSDASTMFFDGQFLYIPTVRSGNISSDGGSYAGSLNIFDTLALTFNTIPVFGYHGNNSGINNSATFISNIFGKDGFVYLCIIEEFGLTITRYNTVDNTQQILWFPIFVGVAGSSSPPGGIQTMFQTDHATGDLLVVCSPGATNQVRNFSWFTPDFSNLG